MLRQRWRTEFHYVDQGLEEAEATDLVYVSRMIAEPSRQRLAVSPADNSESVDLLSDEELDLPQW